MSGSPDYEQPPGAGTGVFWSAAIERDDRLESRLRARLDEGEQLLGVFRIAKISPPLDTLVVTDRRVAAGWAAEVDTRGWRREVPTASLREVEADGGLLVDLCLVATDGTRQKVGSMRDPDEKPALLRVVAEARGEAPRSGAPVADPEPPPVASSAARREPYLSTQLPSRADGLDALLGAVEAHLDPGEVLYAAVPVVKIQPSLDLLVVTDRRVAAAWTDSLGGVGWVLTVWVADLDRIVVSGLMDNVRLTFSDGSGHKVGSLRRGQDAEPLQAAFTAARAAVARAPVSDDGAATYEVYRPPVTTSDERR